MSADRVALRQTADRAAVRDVIELYMGALDRNDLATVAACFTADADLVYCATDPKPFRFTGGRQFADFQHNFDQHPVHTHTLSSCTIGVDRNEAHADTFGFSTTVVGSSGANSVRVRGLRYIDTLVRVRGRWSINTRTHVSMWQFNAQAEQPALPDGERHSPQSAASMPR